MRSITPRGSLPLITTLLLLLLAAGCSKEKTPTATADRPESILQEEYFQEAFAFLSDVHEKLSDPVLRTETRLHLLAGNDAWAWKRLGYEKEDLGALLARLQTLRPGLEMRWPELLEGEAPSGMTDPRTELTDVLRNTQEWPRIPANASKAPHMCAVGIFFLEMNQCSALPIGHIYDYVNCIYMAYYHFLENLTEGC